MKKSMVLGLLAAFAFASTSVAGPIILRTGVNSTNAVLGEGAIDPFWTISTDGGSTFDAARILFDGGDGGGLAGTICCGMETVGSTAAWISDPSVAGGGSSTAWGIGTTVYIRRTFDTSGFDLSTLALSGVWRIADYTMGIYLNGSLVPGTAIGSGVGTWSSDRSLSAGSSFFVSGVNTLEFRGESVNSGWDGVWFDGTVTGREIDAPVPEPTTLALLGAGLLGGGRRWLRRRG